MPIAKYGVLVGRPISHRFGEGKTPHYQVHVVDNETDYRIAINIKSNESPSELQYYSDDNFHHPILEKLKNLEVGFHALASTPESGALDYIRGNLFDRSKMRLLPPNLSGPDNDLNDEINRFVQRAIADEDALIYAFGQRWGPEENKKDKYFGFKPGNGIHDIHMNQGNVGQFTKDNGVWQDGGLMIHLGGENRWIAAFFKFQSQAWHTDDTTGNRLTEEQPTEPTPTIPVPHPIEGEPDFVVRIISALVNPTGNDQGLEKVTLLNTSNQDIALDGWKIANKRKEKHTIAGTINAGSTFVVELPVQVPLSNDGGIITLLDAQGLKVHGVQYTKQQANREGWTIVFS